MLRTIAPILFGLTVFTACGGGKVHNASALNAYRSSKASVAVVSLYVNDYSNILKGGNLGSADVDALINGKLNEMVTIAETKLGNHFAVTPVGDFASKDDFQQMKSSQAFEVFRPKYEGKPLPIFAADRGELIKSAMTPAAATKIASSLGVDMICVVYSEWQTKTGGIVPTTKPVAKTVMAIYDKNGEQLYSMRKDAVGGRNVGAFNATAINDETISAWVEAYDKTLQFLVDGI